MGYINFNLIKSKGIDKVTAKNIINKQAWKDIILVEMQ